MFHISNSKLQCKVYSLNLYFGILQNDSQKYASFEENLLQ